MVAMFLDGSRLIGESLKKTQQTSFQFGTAVHEIIKMWNVKGKNCQHSDGNSSHDRLVLVS
jgi:hypothetical protein